MPDNLLVSWRSLRVLPFEFIHVVNADLAISALTKRT